jgi:flavin reductase (DIM6/NTAB) family NADH-FMN oxidoreductase RutF
MDSNILRNVSYGMYVVSSFKDRSFNAQIANTVFQITSEPATIAVSINKDNLTHEFIDNSLSFSVAILSQDAPLAYIGRFGFKSGRNTDKFKGIKFKVLESGCPIPLDNSIGYLEAKVINKLDCGTHTLFLGLITGSEMLNTAKPMTYEYYHQVKRGTTPASAPTFIKGEDNKAIS